MLLLFNICTSSWGLRVLLILKIVLQVICTIIPLVIIYRAFSVSLKNSIDGGKEVKKDLSGLFKSFVAGLIIFIIPIMINYTFNDLIKSDNDFVSCINNASLEGVLEAEAREKQELADKKKQEELEAQKISEEMQEDRKEDIDKTAKKKKEQEEKHPRTVDGGGGTIGDPASPNLTGNAWVQALLSGAKEVTDYIRAHNFTYGYATVNPALDQSQGIVACDNCVGWFLYKAGYTDGQPSFYGLDLSSSQTFMQQRGFTKITDPSKLQPGDIVYVNPNASGFPGHVFLLGNYIGDGIWERYDCGSVDRIRLTGGYSGYSSQPFHEPINNFAFAYRSPKAS